MEKKELENRRFCAKCGAELDAGALFCGRCGTKQDKAEGGDAMLPAAKVAPQSPPKPTTPSHPPQQPQAQPQHSQGFAQQPQDYPPQQGYPQQPYGYPPQGYPQQPYGYPLQPGYPQSQVIIGQQPKSMGLALILTFLFGPLGLLYANVKDGLILICIAIAVAILTLGFGLIFVWIGSMVWAYMDVEKYNRALMSGQPLPKDF